jgi:SAM-dependent methyltransferase
MLGATQTITTDIAPVPLLWVLPLGVYLLTFALAFSRFAWAGRGWSTILLAVATVGVAGSAWAFGKPWPWLLVPLHLVALFAVGMVCHARLAADRPEPARLTEYFLLVGLGGVVGGAFNALLAPLLFDSFVEYPAALVLACLLRPRWDRERGRRSWAPFVLPVALALAIVGIRLTLEALAVQSVGLVAAVQVGIPCALCLALVRWRAPFALGVLVLFVLGGAQTQAATPTLVAERTYLGTYKVKRLLGPPYRVALASGSAIAGPPVFHVLYHGTTRHGSQQIDPDGSQAPTSYYHPSGPLGQVFGALGRDARLDRVAVLGLGAGAIAAYGRRGQEMTFYEIDPAVVRVARDSGTFTYLRDSAAAIRYEIGDARLRIAGAPDASYGLVVADAFSSGAVPVHLLTKEAVEIYLRKLRPDGLLLVHVTNQYLGLEPVLDALAHDLGLAGLLQWDDVKKLEEMIAGKDASTWVLLARDRASFGALASDPRWKELPLSDGALDRSRLLWTDDYSNLWNVLK